MTARAGGAQLDGSRRTLDPKLRVVWSIAASGPLVVIGLIVLALLTTNAAGMAAIGIVGLIWVALVCAALGLVALNWKRWSWSAWSDALELQHGVVTRRHSVVPYHRIQQIDVHRGPLERSLGLCTLLLRTAAATTDAKLPGIQFTDADALRHELLKRSGADDAV